MPDSTRNLVVLITHGIDHELSSVAFTIANGGISAGLKVSVFLTTAGVDLARKRAVDTTQVEPLEPLAGLINDFLARGGTLWACTPCVKSRGFARGSRGGDGHHGREPHARAHPGWRCHVELLTRKMTNHENGRRDGARKQGQTYVQRGGAESGR
jgi:predicted peroxiredoxin